MECNRLLNSNVMINPLLLKLKPKPLFSKFPQFSTISQHLLNPSQAIQSPNSKPSSNSKDNIQIIKQKWLHSLSNNELNKPNQDLEGNDCELKWVIGVDPDISGALALLKSDYSGIVFAEVFDSPFVQVAIGKRFRKRLDARSIVQLVQSFNAPTGSIAYLEQSIPFPQDGKQGWWSGGFGYGLWIGVLVASGFSVVPVPSSVWKKELELVRGRSSKDESRELATQLFPSLSSMLKRKKDHGRAEALLIAAYGNGHTIKTDLLVNSDQEICETAPEIEINKSTKTKHSSKYDLGSSRIKIIETEKPLAIWKEICETTPKIEINRNTKTKRSSKNDLGSTGIEIIETEKPLAICK